MSENVFDQMRRAVGEARYIQRACDNVTGEMASMIAGRLRKSNVAHGTLVKLKRELSKYNMHTGQWKD